MPFFGEYLKTREEAIAQAKKKSDLLAEDNLPSVNRPPLAPSKPVPLVKDVIGLALPKIGAYKRLDTTQQVVALINDVSFILLQQYKTFLLL